MCPSLRHYAEFLKLACSVAPPLCLLLMMAGVCFCCAQERLLHQQHGSNWKRAFYLPTGGSGADVGVTKFRQWMDSAPIPWPAGISTDLGPVLPREVVMDRYSQHVKGCKQCSAALKWVEIAQVSSRLHSTRQLQR